MIKKLRGVVLCLFSYLVVVTGCLSGIKELNFTGYCNYENLMAAAESNGCTEAEILTYLDIEDSSMSSAKVTELCNAAVNDALDNPFDFSDIAKGGYQFDREFMNGGSDWNNMFNPDLERVQWVEDHIHHNIGISFPEYLHNFKLGDDGNCDSSAVMCCWTADSSSAGDGGCTDSSGCQDAEPIDNTDVCYVDIEDSYLASHTADGAVFFPGDSEGNVNCMGFAWDPNDENDLANLYKGNLLFEVAMMHGLKQNGYTRNVPHAPMCACVDQMPIVSKSECKGISKAGPNTWSIGLDASTGLIKLWQASVNLIFDDCDGQDLATKYSNIHASSSISHRITGQCNDNDDSGKQGYALAENSIKWVKVAGKGSYAEPDNQKHTEQFLDGNISPHTSYSREDFEQLWATSTNQILLRICKYCAITHRYTYLKRYDTNGLPSNVDLLNMVKDNWKEHDNNRAQTDFKLFSTYDDAIEDKHAWVSINSDYYNIGFPRDSGPDEYVYNQWNTWETPLHNRHYGQSSVAFYVAVKV